MSKKHYDKYVKWLVEDMKELKKHLKKFKKDSFMHTVTLGAFEAEESALTEYIRLKHYNDKEYDHDTFYRYKFDLKKPGYYSIIESKTDE